MSNETNEILTIAGKRVRVVRGDGAIIDTDCSLCAFCRFDGNEYSCRFPNRKEPCAPYVTEDSYAYFVPAEEKRRKIRVKNMGKIKAELQKNIDEAKGIGGISQKVTLIPSNEDADKAAEMAARRAYPYEGGTKGDICEASIPIFCKGFKAGIAYERERKTQRVGEEWGDKVAEKTEIIFSTDGELTVYSFVGAPRWWATIREAEEALSVFKAGICWRKAQMEERITLIQKSWYEQGKIDGKYEGLADDEKYQQGVFDERERLMKDAVDGEVVSDLKNVNHVRTMSKIPDTLYFGEKVSVIIIKKEK